MSEIATMWNSPTIDEGNVELNGRICTCGVWVPWGQAHSCWSYWPTYWQSQPTAPTVTKFKGALKALSNLPKNAQTGDAYFIEKDGVLVVRVWNGWHHFD